MTVAVTLGKDKCREVLLALVSGGSHIDFRNRSGLTAMHRAAIVGNAEAIKVYFHSYIFCTGFIFLIIQY